MNDLDTAHKVCTPNELAAHTLHQRGLSQRTIALALGVSRATIRARLARAHTKITDAARKDHTT